MVIDNEVIKQYRNDAQGLAKYFDGKYFENHERIFPINPFQILTDLGIHFVFRNFKKLEGLYLPATKDMPADLVAININRPITRQRFSATHELCHYLKNARNQSFMCATASNDFIEKYAESFAAAFLMPEDELQRQIELRDRNGELTLEDVLIISDHFGTSFKACYYRIRSIYPYLIPYFKPNQLDKYKPERKRSELGLTYTGLYCSLFDAWEDVNNQFASDFARQVFKNRYVYNDARLEGVDTSLEATAEIVEDLQNNRQLSRYCSDTYECYCHVAGHAVMYDYIFDHAHDNNFSIYMLSTLNAKLFSCFPNPAYGGNTRTANPIVLGAKFETVDWRDVMPELIKLNNKVIELEANAANMKRSDIIKEIVKIHHRITVIHPFGDGNGRTGRAFMNEMLIRYGLAPLYIKTDKKEEYLAALEIADKKNNFDKLYECIMKGIMQAHVEMADQA